MEFAWDEEKRRETLRRGLHFANVAEFEWDLAILCEDFTQDEIRTKALGPLQGELVVVIYTPRHDVCRIHWMLCALPGRSCVQD